MKVPWYAKVSFIFLLIIACTAYGYLIHRRHWWPHEFVNQVYQLVRVYQKFDAIVTVNRMVMAPPDASRKVFTAYKPAEVSKGYYAFLGWDAEQNTYGAKLMDDTGKLLHTWLLDFSSYNPDAGFKKDQPHGFAVLPDGSIIINFDTGQVMVRLDECGKPIWVKKGYFHHSLSQADDGSFWTWRGANGAYAQYQYMVNFDPKNGKTIKEIDLVEDVVKNMKDPSEVFLIRNNFRFRSLKVQYHTRFDLFHPNDLEALPQKYAAAFPMFKPGDLLFSLKMLNLVAVLDPDSKQVKWWSHGPWRWQHDPDFTPNGAISVYNNNADLDRSEIIKIDPATHQARNDLAEGDLSFYSRTMGKQQYLPDGNILIVVPGQGRAFLVSSTGNKIMEYNNISHDNLKHNLHIENGVWLPPGYFDHLPLCPK